MPNDYDFPAINTFRKKVGLPSLKKWRVAIEDTLVTGRILTMIKHKGFLRNGNSTVKQRDTTVTKQGYMIIYSSDEKGYVVDIPEALKVNTCTTTLRAKDLGGVSTVIKRTQIEIKMPFGSVMLSILGKEAVPWIEAINRMASPSNKDNRDRLSSCQLESIPALKRESVNLDYSTISDNSISIASPKFELRKLGPGDGSVTPTPSGRLSITPTPKRRTLSPLMPKKVSPKKPLLKQSVVEVYSIVQKNGEQEEKKRRNTLEEEVVIEGEKKEERKGSAPAEVTEEKTPRV